MKHFLPVILALLILASYGSTGNSFELVNASEVQLGVAYVVAVATPHTELQLRGELAEVSAYTSDPLETDDSPLIAADGTRVYDGMAANNCLPFGSEVEIKGKKYQIHDRMNKRYGCNHYDIWMAEKDAANEWGRRNVEVKIIK